VNKRPHREKEILNRPLWQRQQGEPPLIGYLVLILLYAAASFVVSRVSRSVDVFRIGESVIPFSAFAGVLSSLSNICIMLLVVFYNRRGFYTDLVLMALQLPIMFNGIILQRNLGSLPGFFSHLFTLIAIILLDRRNRQIERYRREEVERLKEQHQASMRLFEQTATALVSAIDAKDPYSHGHSLRVAEYSKKIAETAGRDPEACTRAYYSALLHDVGKIGIPNHIINKKGKLTEEEYDLIKQQHPVIGSQILSSIREYPFLSLGARYHHEWYDGTGYPEGLKGKDIPEIARIISVADAYDAMTSNRSYRETIPQAQVRAEIARGSGTQFDPEFADAMLHLIDLDTEYRMRE